MRTAAELAQLFAEIEDPDRVSPDRVATLMRRVRHFSQAKMILPSMDARDKRGTEQFDVVAACTARILSEHADYGISGDLLRQVADRLAPRATGHLEGRDVQGVWRSRPYWNEATEEGTVPPDGHIAHLPARVAAGENWQFRLNLMAQHSYRSVRGGLCRADHVEAESPEWSDVLAFQNIRKVGQITFDVTVLCRPVVAGFDR